MTLSGHHRHLVRVLARTMFTRERAPAVDADDAGVEAWFVAWFDRLPALQQAAITGALGAFDLAFGAWSGRPARSFVEGAHGERAAFLEVCVETPRFLPRQVFELLRFALVAAYADSPAVCDELGMEDPVTTARARVGA